MLIFRFLAVDHPVTFLADRTATHDAVVYLSVKCQIKFVERIDNKTPLCAECTNDQKGVVFSCRLKESKLNSGSHRPYGSEFQVSGAATENARRP